MLHASHLLRISVVSIIASLSSTIALAQPGANSYLSIAGIDGESQTVPGAIDIQSYSFNTRSTGGRANFSDFTFTATVSKASPPLMLAVAQGQVFANAVLSVRRTDGIQAEFAKFTLTNVIITSYQPSNQSNSVLPTEQFSLSYTRINYEYWVINPDGTQGDHVAGCWDIPRSMRCSATWLSGFQAFRAF